MANELKYTYGSEVILEASGASAASNAFAAADDTSLASANHSNYPLANFSLKCDFGAAVAANVVVNLYRQDFDVNDLGEDAPAPSTTYKSLYVGSFVIPSGQSASATYPLMAVPLSKVCKFSIENGTAQNLSAGWVLKCYPVSYVPGS
jgi:hypothetical protein